MGERVNKRTKSIEVQDFYTTCDFCDAEFLRSSSDVELNCRSSRTEVGWATIEVLTSPGHTLIYTICPQCLIIKDIHR